MAMNSQRELNPFAPPFYPSRLNHHHHHASITNNRTKNWSVHFPVATGPRNRGAPRRKPKEKVKPARPNEGVKRWSIKKQNHREILKLEFNDNVSTSVMIRNIPNNYTRELLVKFLENHCKTQNEMVENDGKSAFDFVYLPIDFKHRLNVGYAFVNFTTSEAAWKFHVCVTGKRWPMFESKKIAQVVRARIQGKNSLVKHFEDMRLCSPFKEYLPVWFDPPRDGSMSSSTTMRMHTIGAVSTRLIC